MSAANDPVGGLSSAPFNMPSSQPRRRRSWVGAAFRRLVVVAVLATIVVGGWWILRNYVWAADSGIEQHLTHTVKRGDLVVTVTEDGNVESAANIEIRCQVAGGATIKKIVTDGTVVKEGEPLVELDSSAIDEQILTQRIAFEKARAVRDQALNDLQAAKISLQEYVEGTFVKELQTAEANITIAQENLRSAQNTMDYTDKMFRKGYVTQLQQEAQQFAVKRSQLELDLQLTAKKVLQNFTFAKMKNDLESLVATSEAKAKSEQAAFELEESKLKRLETQKMNCTIVAPQSGMVVYANESSGGRFGGGSDRPKIEEGAAVRESQVILRVPDLSQMQVKVTVHESKVESLRIGMPASVRIQNRKLTGYVTSIANQPESTSMFSAGVKEYATYVRIDGVQTDLKPGMTAEVVILIDERKNVLAVPIQCVVEQHGKHYCWRLAQQIPMKTEIQLGVGDDRQVEVRQGLADGDVVLQSPPERSEGNFSTRDRSQFGTGKRAGDGQPEGSSGSTGDDKPTPGARSGGRRADLMTLDKDGDGRIGREEAPEQMKAAFNRIDADADGYITPAEAQSAAERLRAAGAPPGGPPPSGGQD